MPKMFLVRGLPGSGKSTFAKSLGIFHVEQDMRLIRDGKYEWSKGTISDAVRFCQTAAKMAILDGIDLVVSNTFTRVWEMDFYLKLAEKFGYDVTVVKMPGDFGSIHDVPESSLIAMRDRWEDFAGEVAPPQACA